MSRELIALRDLLEQVMDSIAVEKGEAPTPEVIQNVKTQFPAIIQACSPKLVDIALTKLICEVGRRTRNPFRAMPQPDLFAGFHGIPKAIMIPSNDGDQTAVRKLLLKARLSEVKRWLSDEHQAAVAKLDRYRGVVAMLDELSQFASDDDTIEHAIATRAAVKLVA